jgi:hypothetical protein
MMTVRFNTVDVDGLKVSTPWRSQKLGVRDLPPAGPRGAPHPLTCRRTTP